MFKCRIGSKIILSHQILNFRSFLIPLEHTDAAQLLTQWDQQSVQFISFQWCSCLFSFQLPFKWKIKERCQRDQSEIYTHTKIHFFDIITMSGWVACGNMKKSCLQKYSVKISNHYFSKVDWLHKISTYWQHSCSLVEKPIWILCKKETYPSWK